MSISLILTNCLFCSLAALFILPLLKYPDILTYKKGIPLFSVIILIFIRQLFPYEFPFTHTLASKNILPAIKSIANLTLFKNVSVIDLLIFIWLTTAVCLLTNITYKNGKLMRILSLIPETKNETILKILLENCNTPNIQQLRVIQLDIETGPFIIGIRKKIIVLPYGLNESETQFILLHELQHFYHHHLVFKVAAEIMTALYWWNPVIWLLRKQTIQAMEMQADTNVIKTLSNNARLSYLETLVNISKNVTNKEYVNLNLSFTFNRSMIENRVNTALNSELYEKDKKIKLLRIYPLILSMIVLLGSTIYTFESYNKNPLEVAGTFTINRKTDYFVLHDDNLYDLYINGEYAFTLSYIPEDFKNLAIK